MIERKLTIKQQAFADAYIELGNATQAYLKAYPNVKKETTAKANASRLLTNANVSAYIVERMEELKSERVADQQEILELLTSVLRGEAQSAVLRGIGEGAQTIDEEMPPTTAERIKAAELLGKRYAMWTDKQEISGTVTPIFVDDISGEKK
ncbi:terminase small subunit [Lysinibacillus sp. KU-BSD001]|uniref:terminase small subunit n=1 Tax=Lysinibacillus sp. KU-BSD001 TaxID=3141328 RepID=UPI0036E1BD17